MKRLSVRSRSALARGRGRRRARNPAQLLPGHCLDLAGGGDDAHGQARRRVLAGPSPADRDHAWRRSHHGSPPPNVSPGACASALPFRVIESARGRHAHPDRLAAAPHRPAARRAGADDRGAGRGARRPRAGAHPPPRLCRSTCCRRSPKRCCSSTRASGGSPGAFARNANTAATMPPSPSSEKRQRTRRR